MSLWSNATLRSLIQRGGVLRWLPKSTPPTPLGRWGVGAHATWSLPYDHDAGDYEPLNQCILKHLPTTSGWVCNECLQQIPTFDVVKLQDGTHISQKCRYPTRKIRG